MCPASHEEMDLLLSWLQKQEVETLNDIRCAGDLSDLEGQCTLIECKGLVCEGALMTGARELPGNILEFLQDFSDGKRKARRLQPPAAAPKPQAPEVQL